MALTQTERAELDRLAAQQAQQEGRIAVTGTVIADHHGRILATEAWQQGTDAWGSGVQTWMGEVDAWGADAHDRISLADLRSSYARDVANTATGRANHAHARLDAANDPSSTILQGIFTAVGWTLAVLLGAWWASGVKNGTNQLGDHTAFRSVMIGSWVVGLGLIAWITVSAILNRGDQVAVAPQGANPPVANTPPTPAAPTAVMPAVPPASPAPQPVVQAPPPPPPAARQPAMVGGPQLAPQGWYPNPAGTGTQRYWNGTAWA